MAGVATDLSGDGALSRFGGFTSDSLSQAVVDFPKSTPYKRFSIAAGGPQIINIESLER